MVDAIAKLEADGFKLILIDPSDADLTGHRGIGASLGVFNEVDTVRYDSEALTALAKNSGVKFHYTRTKHGPSKLWPKFMKKL
jgi:hypothetical protein